MRGLREVSGVGMILETEISKHGLMTKNGDDQDIASDLTLAAIRHPRAALRSEIFHDMNNRQ